MYQIKIKSPKHFKKLSTLTNVLTRNLKKLKAMFCQHITLFIPDNTDVNKPI